MSRWSYKKLVFLLFHNGDIIPVSAFLYFFIFLKRVILKYTRRSTIKTVTVLLASPHFFPTNPPGAYIVYMHRKPATVAAAAAVVVVLVVVAAVLAAFTNTDRQTEGQTKKRKGRDQWLGGGKWGQGGTKEGC